MLDNLKEMLNITDADLDDKLEQIISACSQRLILILGLMPIKNEDGTVKAPSVPKALEWLVVDVACERFNRIGSEGMRSDSVEGESITFYDHDFDPYRDEINGWLATQSDDVTGGKAKVRFI